MTASDRGGTSCQAGAADLALPVHRRSGPSGGRELHASRATVGANNPYGHILITPPGTAGPRRVVRSM